jgi:hypothetical protein
MNSVILHRTQILQECGPFAIMRDKDVKEVLPKIKGHTYCAAKSCSAKRCTEIMIYCLFDKGKALMHTSLCESLEKPTWERL